MRTTPKHVLIAEDDKFLAGVVGKFLSGHGLQVTIAHDGRETVEAIEKTKPHLLLLDILLPVLDGHGVLKAIKEKKIDCPVIVMSNLSDKRIKQRCKEMRVKAYFVKSDLDEASLLPAIKRYMC